ncbi:MAG TPA: DUF1501 domain-containing protein [Microthrixaceae bacterium]|nr:DUF1501 domain-containing protein [Microthrixaceae bacterium]HMT26049.1 DUF1501 domain-containing protein [Microthrixaceae bacterium]HMT60753.1 DUF1501 domain-containing protein [Microthrixaceae bacterium]
MTARRSLSSPVSAGSTGLSRRDLMRWLAYGSAAVGIGLPACSTDRSDAPSAGRKRNLAQSPRVLVVIELGGGNDGWSTLIPYESGAFRDLRPTIGHRADEVIDWGDGVGLNARLSMLAKHKPAILEGIGTSDVDMSHFEMFARWHRGRVGATAPSSGPASDTDPTGVLGRICDEVGGSDGLTGISLGWGDHPSMIAGRAATTGLLPIKDSALSDPRRANDQRSLVESLTRGTRGTRDVDDPVARAQRSLGLFADLLRLTIELPAAPSTFPESPLGDQLAFATRLIAADAGIRVIHVPMGAAAFDTHIKHRASHDALMDSINAALPPFLDELRRLGVADRVLVATASEFGRRPRQNGDGLDHGGASVAMLLGPVAAGRHGEPSPLNRFDPSDNLLATVEFDRYQATLASFLDVDPAAILPASGGKAVEPIVGILA